ncbi:MAG: hypothetical protein R3Y67_07895 [Eubacteriales bacterium]
MNQEALFAQSLKTFVSQARAQGNVVSREQIQEHFAEMNLNEEQVGFVEEYLIANKIGVEEELVLDDYLTEEEKNYLAIYLDEIQAYDQITKEEKSAIIKGAMNGDEVAKEQLIQMYLPKVVSIAKLYIGQGVLLEDLIGEGNIGLTLVSEMLLCCESEEEVEGMIGKVIMDAMEDFMAQDTIQAEADQAMLERINTLSDKVTELAQMMQRSITLEELMENSEYTRDEIMELVLMSGNQMELLEWRSE